MRIKEEMESIEKKKEGKKMIRKNEDIKKGKEEWKERNQKKETLTGVLNARNTLPHVSPALWNSSNNRLSSAHT